MSAFQSFRISASGLTAERLRMDVISNNLANANTTRTEDGEPYRRQFPVFAPLEESAAPGRNSQHSFGVKAAGSGPVGSGVRVVGIEEDAGPPRLKYDPEHPDANAEGYVEMPKVHVVKEMVDLIGAARAYEANITAINSAKSMAQKALEIGR